MDAELPRATALPYAAAAAVEGERKLPSPGPYSGRKGLPLPGVPASLPALATAGLTIRAPKAAPRAALRPPPPAGEGEGRGGARAALLGVAARAER